MLQTNPLRISVSEKKKFAFYSEKLVKILPQTPDPTLNPIPKYCNATALFSWMDTTIRFRIDVSRPTAPPNRLYCVVL